MFTLLIVVIVIALLFDLVNGFHDAANSIATVVSTKVLTPLQAVIWAAFFNIVAYWVFDMSVGNTVAKTVDNTAIDLWVIFAGLVAATVWNLLTWWLGIPSSSSHTLIGGFAGAAVTHVTMQTGSLSEGFGVIAGKEILTIILFIFLAPIIGGFISYMITVATIARNFWNKMLVIALLSTLTIFGILYMVEYMDVKIIMLYIVAAMIGVFVLVYTFHYLAYRNRPSALREAEMHKKLQLLSSAAFSLGHGGADSQKVMGIICAALLVYGNTERKAGTEDNIGKPFAITELVQIEFHNANGKLEKFKPEYAVVDSTLYYVNHHKIVRGTGEIIYNESGTLVAQNKVNIPSYKAIDTSLVKLEVFMNGKDLCDAKSKEIIFKDKVLNPAYRHAMLFSNFVNPNGELKSGHKIKTKVHSETMPFWIAFGCYFMIGLGTLMGGWKIVKTMGSKITKVTPLEGVCAETAGALTLFTVSNFGIPVSTTHTITGSIIGVGATKRLSAVRWGVTVNLLWAWILTIPVSALLAGLIYVLVYFLR
ncbi:MAG: inorganic phosphate transporter [Flavobacteriia bacterium]|jgi:PiT family inorganic phosphate transporter|nr:inorganic phosphate transporter [Flavobacteriia bacterium]NBP28433.1 inorganic phosphate transporter [Flavobacteriia bacterium]